MTLLRRYLEIDKNTQDVMFSGCKTSWETPQWLYDKLDEEFHFTLDAAASDSNHKCARYYTVADDGLTQDWAEETVFVHPPYGNKEIRDWTRKCYEEAQKPNTTVVLLVPAQTDQADFLNYIYDANTNVVRLGVGVQFLKNRLVFEINGTPTDVAPFPSMIVTFKDVPKQKCNCWHKETYPEWNAWRQRYFPCDRYVCWGTEEHAKCSCGGDPAKCDFYPEKREKCTFDEKEDKPMKTAEMWLAAQNNAKKYKYQDMRYKRTTGFCDSSGQNWNPNAFRSIEDIMQCEWTECKEMTRVEAEKALGVDIID